MRVRRPLAVVAAAALLAAQALAVEPPTSLQPASTTTGTNDPVALVAADFDGDGDTDLLFADGTVGLVKIRRNEGDGLTYTTTGFTVSGATVRDAAVGDMDGDQDPDVVLATSAGVIVARNGGVSGAAISFDVGAPVLPAASAIPTRIALADYDGDQDLDVVTCGSFDSAEFPSGGYVGVQLNSGGAVGAGTIEPRASEPDGVAAGDLDGDLRAEVVFVDDRGNYLSSEQAYYTNPGTGAVQLDASTRVPLGGYLNARDCEVVDLTGDGRLDLLFSGWGEYTQGQNRGEFAVFRNVAEAASYSFVAELRVIHTFPAAPFAGPVAYPVAVADMNGGGPPEIVTLSPLEDVVKVFQYRIETDDAGFVAMVPVEIVAQVAGESPRHLVVARLDADAKPDVAAAIPNAPAAVLLNGTGGGGGGGDPLRGALSLKVVAKATKGDYPSGGKWKFSCVQPEGADGLTVRVQSSETPGVASSWQDLPGAPPMVKGKKGKYSLTVFQVPPGLRYFRTVTSAPGRADGVNSAPDGLDRYIGPFHVVAGQPSLLLTATILPAGDLVARKRTFPGDLIAFHFVCRNTGASLARNVRVQARVPRQTTLVGYTPEEGATLANNGTRVDWEVGDLLPDATVELSFGVIVDADASGVVRFEDMSTGGDNVRTTQRDPPGRVELVVGSPLTLTVAARTPEPDVGGRMSWDLTASNVGVSTYANAVVMDRLPVGTSFDAAYFTDANGDAVASPVAAPGGRSNPYFERSTRRVFWYLGDLDGQETARLRLDTTVQFDVAPGAELVNDAWQLRASPPGTAGDPLQFERLRADSGEPRDVAVATSEDEPAGSPTLRLSQYGDVLDRPGSVFDRTYGAVTTVVPGGRVRHSFLLQNTGGATARAVRLHGNLAHQTTFVAAGGVRVTNLADSSVGQAQVSLASGGTLEAVLGDVPAGSAYLVEYDADVLPAAKPGTTLVFTGYNLRTDSLSEPLFAGPEQFKVLVSQPFAPAVTLTGPAAGSEGEYLRYVASLSNAGDVPGAACKVTITVPKGMKMADDPSDGIAGGAVLYDEDGDVVEVLPANAAAKSATFQIPTARAGAVGTAVLVVQVVKRQPSVVVPCQATFTGTTASGKAAGKPASAKYSTGTVVRGQAELVLHRHAPVSASKGLEFSYVLGVSNSTGVDALDVRAEFEAPSGTRLAGVATTDPGSRVRGQKVTWVLGTVPAHGTRLLSVHVQMDTDPPGCAIVSESFGATSSNAIVWVPDPTATVALTPDRRFETFRWPALSCLLSARGMKIDAARDGALDQAVQRLNATGLNSSVGAGIVHLKDGALMLPLGGGNMVAAGAGNMVAAGGLNLVAAGGGNLVAAGAGNLVTFSVAGLGNLDASQLLTRHSELVAAGAGNIVAAGGGNLIGLDGGSLIGLDGGSILAQVSPVITSNMVAAGAGNLVAAGGGNMVAAGGLNLVAAGAGNMVAAGGLNLRSSLGASIVAAGGGNMVAAGGLNMVAAGAGNLVAAGAGNMVAAGAGNFAPAGGPHKAPRTVMIRAKGLPEDR